MSTIIVFPIYQGVTQLDFTGPHQVFSRLPGAKIIVATQDGAPVVTDGLCFGGLETLGSVERCDVLCVPGGGGCNQAMLDTGFIANIRRLAATATYVTSVCTGSLILGAAGLLQGKRAACHWASRPLLARFGATPDPARVVKDGNIITGGGITAGIDFALTLVTELAGIDAAKKIQLNLEYAPDPPVSAGRPEIAEGPIVQAVLEGLAPILKEREAAVEAASRSLGMYRH